MSRRCGKIGDEVVGTGHAQRIPGAFVAELAVHRHVRPNCAGEQKRLLEDQRSGARTRGDVATIGSDETAGQLDKGALARAGRSDDGDDPTAGNGERDVRHRWLGLADEGERDVVEAKPDAGGSGGHRGQWVRFDRLVENLANACPTGQRERHRREHVTDQAQREDEQREQVDEARQLADGERSTLHPAGADDDDDHVGQRWHHVEHRLERAAQADGLDARVTHPSGDLGQSLGLALLGAIGLDELHTLEALVDARRKVAEFGLRRIEVPIDTPLVDDVRHQQHREQGNRHQPEDHVGGQQPDGGEHDHQDGAGGVRNRRENGDGRVGVDGPSADEVAVGTPLVPGDRLADRVGR